MKDDPVFWLVEHIDKGIHLREKGKSFRVDNFIETGSWERQVDQWERELIDGVRARRPIDAFKVSTLDKFPPLNIPEGYAWHDPAAVNLGQTSSGEGQPGNNPLSRLDARIERAKELLEEWKQVPPAENEKPPPMKVRAVPWAPRMGFKANHSVAVEIARDETAKGEAWAVTPEQVKRAVFDVPGYQSQGKSGKGRKFT